MGSQDWETPDDLFKLLDDKWHFTLDAAASADNTKCERYLDETVNALRVELHGEIVFCNPPYADMAPWVRRFIKWADSGNYLVVLCQDKTDTIWFKELWGRAHIVRFLHGRVQFKGTLTGNMHGAVVFVLGNSILAGSPAVDIWDWRKEIG